MAKFWTTGSVKTRLGKSIGMAPAAQIHRLFTMHLCRTLCDIAHRQELCIAPERHIPEVHAAVADETPPDKQPIGGWNIVPQGKGDLGQRMSNWFQRNSTGSATTAILIGADCPTLQPDTIERAHDLLSHSDVVIGPAIDGGYYLIGLRGRWNGRFASLFVDMPWSGPEVCEITCKRITQSGLSLASLATAEDVDTIVELNRLQHRLRPFTPPHRFAGLQIEIERILAQPRPAEKLRS